MAYEHKDMTGSLWSNRYKKTDKQPDLKGQIMVAGILYDVAAWKKKMQGGKGFLSLSISKPYVKPQNGADAPLNGNGIPNDDIPF